jgi:3',5'-cyclic AMP phosphodiesterase CpdA
MKKALLVLFITVIFCAIAVSQISYFQNAAHDDKYFEAAERIVFTTPQEVSLNIIPKQGKILDLKIHFGREGYLSISSLPFQTKTYFNVADSIEIPALINTPQFFYWLEYKESSESTWKRTPERMVKTPLKSSQEKIVIILISDDHSFDDADPDDLIGMITDPLVRQMRLSGNAVNYFLKELNKNPDYILRGDWAYLHQAFCLANTIYQIQKNEHPDLIINLGDTGMGAGHRWLGLGLPDQHKATPAEIDAIAKNYILGMRKIFSAFTPEIPVYWGIGNHDLVSGFNKTREAAIKYRKKYWKQPENGSADENYYWLAWGNAGFEFMPMSASLAPKKGTVLLAILDVMGYNPDLPRKPEDWTLGIEQKLWLKQILEYDADWKFVLGHHVLGGWPKGSDEQETAYAYGRGPLFTADDYKDFSANPNLIEQVELTKLMLEKGVDGFLYSHDHVFAKENIAINSKNRTMYGICVGSPKYIGEPDWYKGFFWKRYYGDFGKYGDYDSNWPPVKADFWGPSGYTKITIEGKNVEVEYIRSAYNCHTNLSPLYKNGDCVQKILF